MTTTALFSGAVARTRRVNVKTVSLDQASKSERMLGCSCCCLQGPLHWGSGNSCEGCQLVTEHEPKGISQLGKGKQSPPTTNTWPDLVLQHPVLLDNPETSLFLVAKTPSELGFKSPAPAAIGSSSVDQGSRSPSGHTYFTNIQQDPSCVKTKQKLTKNFLVRKMILLTSDFEGAQKLCNSLICQGTWRPRHTHWPGLRWENTQGQAHFS